jgi:hypothetical protein
MTARTAATTATPTAILVPQPSIANNSPLAPTRPGKRAAQESLPEAPTKFPRVPEASSINGILRQHARERLYVQPLHWTAQQLRLLKCVFIRQRHAACRTTGTQTTVDERKAQSVAKVAEDLKSLCTPEFKAITIWDMLREHGFYKSCTGSTSELLFNQRPVAKLETDGLFAPSPKAPATLAFLNLDTVAQWRSKSVPMPKSNRMNPPVARIRKRRQAQIQPSKKFHDPYIVAVLIALAQAQRHAGILPESCCDSSTRILPNILGFKVHLLATSSQRLHIYTTCVTLTFLDRFDKPSQCSLAETLPFYDTRLPLNSPTEVSRIIEVISKSIGTGPCYLDSIQTSQDGPD